MYVCMDGWMYCTVCTIQAKEKELRRSPPADKKEKNRVKKSPTKKYDSGKENQVGLP